MKLPDQSAGKWGSERWKWKSLEISPPKPSFRRSEGWLGRHRVGPGIRALGSQAGFLPPLWVGLFRGRQNLAPQSGSNSHPQAPVIGFEVGGSGGFHDPVSGSGWGAVGHFHDPVIGFRGWAVVISMTLSLGSGWGGSGGFHDPKEVAAGGTLPVL